MRFLKNFRSDEVGVLTKNQMTDIHPDNQKLEKRSDDESSPVNSTRRRCTDVLFLLLLICSWIAMTGVGLASTGLIPSSYIPKGDPQRLVNGLDYYGNVCGVSNYETPTGVDTAKLPKAYPMPSGFSVCVESCPSETNYDKFICEYDVQYEIDNLVESDYADLSGEDLEDVTKGLYLFYAARKQCMPQIDSAAFLGFCIPKLSIDEVVVLSTQDNATDTNSTETDEEEIEELTSISIPIASMASSSSSEFLNKAMADVTRVRYVIFSFGCGMSLSLGIIFLIIIQLPGFLSLLVWSMTIAIDVSLVAAGSYSKGISSKWVTAGVRENEATALLITSYVLYALAGLWVLIILFLRKRIVLAVNCVKEAAKAISSMPFITLFPAIQVLGLFVYTLVWGVFMAYLASSGEITAQCMCPREDDNATLSTLLIDTVETNEDGMCDGGCFMHKELIYSSNTKYAALYLLFSWFWTSQFIVAVGQLVVALSISLWYFNRNRSLVKNSTFFRALWLVLSRHLGTAAFGSLIIAIVKTVRAILTYIQKRCTKSKLRIAVVILSIFKCLLFCIEKCLKYINKQAYIQTAIFGYSFCKASKQGFFLILRNALRISAVSVVSQIVLFIGKVFITVASAVCGYYYLEIHFEDQLNYLMVPTSLIAVVAYACSEAFNEVFGMAISTILQCFVVDEEMYDPEERFAPKSLALTIEQTQQKYKKKKQVGIDPS